MKNFNFILTFIASMLILFNAQADEDLTCGNTCHWTYDEETHTLTITGSGAMKDYGPSESVGRLKTTYWAERPWNDFASEVETVIVSGLTSVGNRAFQGMGNLQHVVLPDSITTIGQSSFADTPQVESIFLSDSLVEIRPAAFQGLSGSIYCSEPKKEFCYQEISDHGGRLNNSINDILKTYTKDGDRYVWNGIRYKSLSDMQMGNNAVKRIYTIDEANAVAGTKNRISIRYR